MSKIERTTIFFCLFIIVALGFSTVRGDPMQIGRNWIGLLWSGLEGILGGMGA